MIVMILLGLIDWLSSRIMLDMRLEKIFCRLKLMFRLMVLLKIVSVDRLILSVESVIRLVLVISMIWVVLVIRIWVEGFRLGRCLIWVDSSCDRKLVI